MLKNKPSFSRSLEDEDIPLIEETGEFHQGGLVSIVYEFSVYLFVYHNFRNEIVTKKLNIF